VVGTLIYSTIHILSLHKPEKRRRPRANSGTISIELVAKTCIPYSAHGACFASSACYRRGDTADFTRAPVIACRPKI